MRLLGVVFASARPLLLIASISSTATSFATWTSPERSAAVRFLSDDERGDGYYFKFFAQGLLRGAVKDRGEFYSGLYNIGAINPNEIRELEDMNPYDGGEKYRVPLNMEDPAAAEDGA